MMKPIVPAIILLTQLVACDDVVNVQNRAPFVSDIDVCHDDGRLFWEVQLGDPEEDPTDVALILDVPSDAKGIIASGPRATVGPGPAGVGLVGLITSKGNNRHRIQWVPCKTDMSDCKLTAAIANLTESENCACIEESYQAEQTPPLTILLQDREDTVTELRFPDGIPVSEKCL